MGRWLIVSIGLHAMLLLAGVKTPSLPPSRAPIDVDLRAAPPREMAMLERSGARGGSRGGGGRGGSRRALATSAIIERPSAATENGDRGSVELFPSGVLQKFGAVAPAPGPPTKRADEAGPPSEAQVVGERVREWLEQSAGGERARTLVAPEWRDFERRLVGEFRPPRKIVEEKLSAGTWARQLIGARPESPPLPRPREDTAWNLQNNATSVMEQMGAARAAYREPRLWWRVEIEIGVDAAGAVTARVVSSSGKRALDRHALAAVERAAVGKLEPGALTRWRCEAAIAVDPVPQPVLGFSFDESLRVIKPDVPMIPEVKTRVSLISISRR